MALWNKSKGRSSPDPYGATPGVEQLCEAVRCGGCGGLTKLLPCPVCAQENAKRRKFLAARTGTAVGYEPTFGELGP